MPSYKSLLGEDLIALDQTFRMISRELMPTLERPSQALNTYKLSLHQLRQILPVESVDPYYTSTSWFLPPQVAF